MAKQTLLDMTQNILSALDSDSVNSISDTVEALQVATIIKTKYYDIVSRGNLPSQEILLQLVPSTNPDLPTLMYVPSAVSSIKWIKYFDSNPADGQSVSQFGAYSHAVNTDIVDSSNNSVADMIPGYKYVKIIPIDEFLDMVNRFNPGDDNVVSYTFTEGSYAFNLYLKNNIQPSYCTVLENYYVLFDSYDVGFDDTLQASKTLLCGEKVTPFQMVDNFVPDIDDNEFALLLSEAKALAFFELKQTPHTKAEQEIKRQWSATLKDKSITNKPSHFDQLPSFGRIPRTGGIVGGWKL